MSNPLSIQTDINLQAAFTSNTAQPVKDEKKEKLVPMSFRVTKDERIQIRKDAGSLAVSSYIRQTLVGDKAVARKSHYTEKQRQPGIDHKILAQWLGMLGQSELATSLIALALAAQSGSLPVTPEVEEKLSTACDDVRNMRVALITALNVKPENET